MMKKALLALSAVAGLALAGCQDAEDHIRIGSKNFGESRILAQMMAAVAREQGLPVDGVVEYESTAQILEALKRGDIDAYPEYNGTGLVMLGQAPLTDGDAAMARVKQVFEPLGVSWRERFGFANNYGLAMLPTRAAELGVDSISDLARNDDDLALGVEENFVERPLDGLSPMLQRYGLEFSDTEIVPDEDRGALYDKLLDGEVDVIEVFTTDGQIADFGLTVLADDLEFFPVYEAAPIVRQDSLATYSGLGAALDSLGGAFDADSMQDLNRKVELEGRAPDAVARDALARAGLIAAGAVEADAPLRIAADPVVANSELAANALRAVRRAFSGRAVEIAPDPAALTQVTDGEARLALVGAESFFDLSKPAPLRDDRFEVVAAIGTNAVHLVSLGGAGGVFSLAEARTIAVGPEGTASHALGGVLIDGLGLDASLSVVEDGSIPALLRALQSGADVAAIPARVGERSLVSAFANDSYRLLAVEGWSEGPNLVKYPFLRATRIPGQTYQRQLAPVETLGTQVVLAGPAPAPAAALIGEQGPGATAAPSLKPIPTSTVRAMADSLAGAALIDPTLPSAPAFAPELPEPPAAMNPAPDVSILNIFIVLVLVWAFYLYVRPEYR